MKLEALFNAVIVKPIEIVEKKIWINSSSRYGER